MYKKAALFFSKNYKEIVFQTVVVGLLFWLYSYLQDNMEYSDVARYNFIPYKIAFYANYLFASLIISYILLPKFLSKRKFFQFFLSLSFLLVAVILWDEFFLEKIYFPDTRGLYFPGLIFTLIETLPIITLFVGFKFAWDYIKKHREVEQLKHLVQESELQFLKSQINPHFLFNNLNNLYAYATENSPKTPTIILELSSVLRYMLYDCKEDYVNIEKEIEHLKNYTALNELRIEDRGVITFSSHISSSDVLIAPLILNVFVENAFKHSTASQSENISIAISVLVDEDGFLDFSCKNSFLPIQNTQNLTKGIGLENVKKRLNLMYPKLHDLKIVDKQNTFYVHLKMHLKPKTND